VLAFEDASDQETNMQRATKTITEDGAKTRRNDHASGTDQTVLVFQGGGALGAYQAGVYQAMHEAGIEPDWIIGTSIGAINASLIAGNDPHKRLPLLKEFWDRMAYKEFWHGSSAWPQLSQTLVVSQFEICGCFFR
jgi:NTE family protein